MDKNSLRNKTVGLSATTTLLGGSAGALLLALAASPAAAVGSGYLVDTLDDGVAQAADCVTPVPGSCSLRDAVAASSDGDTIDFDGRLAGTIVLSEGQINITNTIEIRGSGANTIAIDGDRNGRVFYLCTGGETRISGVTITGGSETSGGGIGQDCGDLTLSNVVVTGNWATAGQGGGISSLGTVSIFNSEISNNSAVTGGGIWARSAQLLGATVSGNSSGMGGGVYTTGYFSAVASTVSFNVVGDGGGGGGVMASGDVDILASTFEGNYSESCGGGLYAATAGGSISIMSSTFDANSSGTCYGGAIDVDGNGNTVVIGNTTITGNRAVAGGGLNVDSGNGLSLFQNTITGNSATSTDPLYSGGGLHLSDAVASVELSGTIISDNTAAAGPADIGLGSSNSVSLTIAANSSLLGVGGAIDSRITVDGAANVRSDDPGLGALADNGGPTMTMALLAGSPAIDAGPDPVATFSGNAYDQRGIGFPRIFGGLADIGAYELQEVPEPTTTTTAGGDPVVPEFTG